MNLKSLLALPFANNIYKKTQKDAAAALATQDAILKELIATGKKTIFGKEHHLGETNNYEEFKNAVTIRDYEQIKGYIGQIKEQCHLHKFQYLDNLLGQ